MADEPELATKAPESDAQENDAQEVSGIPGDTKPDQGAASMGEHCVTDRPTPAGQTPTGEITKFDDVEVYITKPADYPHSPSKLLLLLTGGTGIHSTNNQIQADKYASKGFLVVMPDQFGGDPAPTSTTTAAQAEENTTLLEQVKLGVAAVAKSFTIDMWLARHTPEKVLPLLNKVITAVKEEFADAVAHGGGIYGAGYCFGAKYILILGADDSGPKNGEEGAESQAEEGAIHTGPQIKAAAIAHGTQISAEDLANNTAPVCIVAVEQDSLFPDDIRKEGVKGMEERKLEHEVHVYPDVPHGFAVLGDYEDSTIVEKQKEAFDQMVAWLGAH